MQGRIAQIGSHGHDPIAQTAGCGQKTQDVEGVAAGEGEGCAFLEIQAATAKTRVHRGRIHLRRALEEEGVFAPLPRSDVPRQVCLDLLKAKLDAMDRGVDFPLPHGEICDRCFALFRSMDVTQEACASLRTGTMPDTLRERLRAVT